MLAHIGFIIAPATAIPSATERETEALRGKKKVQEVLQHREPGWSEVRQHALMSVI